MKKNFNKLVAVNFNGQTLKLTQKKYDQYKSRGWSDNDIARNLAFTRGKTLSDPAPENNFVSEQNNDYIDERYNSNKRMVNSANSFDGVDPRKLIPILKKHNELSDKRKKAGAAKKRKRKPKTKSTLSDGKDNFFERDPLIKWLRKKFR